MLPMVRAICAMHETLDPTRYGTTPDVNERYRRWLPRRAADSRSVFLVAESGAPDEPSAHQAGPARRIAGFLVGSVEPNIPIYRVAEFGFIHDLWVEPAFRRLGVARLLVREAVARFEALGVSQVRLETAATNEPARRLFAACGFRVATIDMLRDTDR